ncbi:unnamed protein product [Phaedon cochleariae]|uniref:UDP-glucuronosyltransferase n=1 Tax=Phaedon cochleariae TaxID=80249 RepID=A0A9N9SFB6_PHACE|nr:unnamed protein product [Phaedon cochleariae]
MRFVYLIVFIELICAVYGYKILMVFPMPFFSHFRLGSTLADGLAEAGHDVTLVSPFEDKKVPGNGSLRNVVLSLINEFQSDKNFNIFDMAKPGVFLETLFLSYILNDATNKTLEDPALQRLLHSNEKFDVVIIEQFINDGLKALAWHFDAPLIMFSTMGATAWLNSISGNPSPPSYIPDTFVEYGSSMTLWQRTKNSLVKLFHELIRYFIVYPAQDKMVQRHFPGCPSVETLSYNVSLFFLNSHESYAQSVPLVPNMINIGGYHVQPPKKLPVDLQKILDGAKDGVIFFSMGSNINPSQMKSETKQALIDVLGGLKETVLWKWDEEDLPGKTDNMVIRKWFPQMDVLAHPNVKLFITHGGILSTTETIYHRVPILALPVFGDQRLNAAKAVGAGFGVSLHFQDLTKDSFSSALNEALKNSKYLENARKSSVFLHNRPMKPMDLAVYWTEFVARFRGAPHLRVAAVNMPWYKYLLVDVIAMLTIMCLVVLTLLYLIVRKVCCRRSNNLKLKKN